MERSKTENRSAFAQAIKRRDGAMREMFGMESDPVGSERDKRHKPQVVIWRIAGNRDRTGDGWADAVAIGAKRNRLLSLSSGREEKSSPLSLVAIGTQRTRIGLKACVAIHTGRCPARRVKI
jgi:hypothetical protein